MARLFNDAASQGLTYAGAVLTAAPLSMAAWFYTDSATIAQALITTCSDGDTDEWFSLSLAGDVANDPVWAWARHPPEVEPGYAATTAGYSTNTWQHAAAVFASTTSRAAYLDGSNKGTDIADKTPAGLDATGIGQLVDLTPGWWMSGRIAEAAIWNIALTDAEVAILAKGYSPLFVHPQNLVAYWPLIRDEDQDRVGGYDLTPANAPTIATHVPKVIYPVSPILSFERGICTTTVTITTTTTITVTAQQ